jgi:hypothetical protein
MSIFGAGHEVVTSTTRPASPTIGQIIYQTDTDEFLKYVIDTDSTTRWMQADQDYNRNLVINGAFDIWQRATTSTVSSSDYYGPADRWQTTRLSSDTGRTFSRQAVTSSDTPVLNFNYYMRCQRDSANVATNAIIMSSSFETVNVRKMQNKYVTLSFYARAGANFSPTSGYLVASITTGTGTDGRLITGNFTSSATLATSNNVLTTSWKRFTVTTSAAVGNTITQMGITFQFNPVGTAGAADYYDVTGVQLEVGSAPSRFEFEPFETTLRKCKRYYVRKNVYAGGSVGGSFNAYIVAVQLEPQMRVAPVVAWISGGIAMDGTADYGITGLFFSPSYRNGTVDGVEVLYTGPAFVANARGVTVRQAITEFNAEL